MKRQRCPHPGCGGRLLLDLNPHARLSVPEERWVQVCLLCGREYQTPEHTQHERTETERIEALMASWRAEARTPGWPAGVSHAEMAQRRTG